MRKILLIDDDITSLDIVSFLFEAGGYEVVRFADGASALEQARMLKPDLSVVDLMMPGIDGIETIQRLRELGLSEMPIIAFTAVDDTELHEEAKLAGCQQVLTKPVRPEKLLSAVKALLAD